VTKRTEAGPARTYKCPLCREFFTEQALREHKCRCLMDGNRQPRTLLPQQIERVLAHGHSASRGGTSVPATGRP
jgi:hypothetical protein